MVGSMLRRWSPTGDASAFAAEDVRCLRGVLCDLIGVSAELLHAAVDLCTAAHGSVLGFMRAELGLTAKLQRRLQAAFLEDVAQPPHHDPSEKSRL